MYKIPANTLLLGKNMVFVPECHSTNEYAQQLTQNANAPEGTVVITNNQTAGRGQRGNNWEAEPGMNFTFSILLRPKLPVNEQFFLNIFASLAICDYIKQKTVSLVQIKWPNDVLIEGRKVCGILIENQVQGMQFSNCIAGIGLNMNQQKFANVKATSLSLQTGIVYHLEVELALLLKNLEVRYLQLANGQHHQLLQSYLEALYWRNELHTFKAGETVFEGTITGIDAMGRLEIIVDGKKKHFGIKEVAYQALP